MQQHISKNSKVQLYDIGLMLGMLLQSQCKSVISGMFGDTWKVVNMPSRNVLGNVMEYHRREGEVGYATNGYKVIDDLFTRKVMADKVMLFTDVQMYDSSLMGNSVERSWKRYKTIAPNAKLYIFDLAGHGRAPINMQRNDVCLIAGWSDKIFDILHALDNSGNALAAINEIEL
jgi:hypothetical protein